MTKYVKPMLSAVGEHLLYALLSFFLVGTFGSIFKNSLPVVSVITAIIYLSSAYSAAWHISGKDLRRANEAVRVDPEAKYTYRIYDGFIIALPLLLIGAFLLIMAHIMPGTPWFIAFRVFDVYMLFLYDIKNLGILPEILAVIFPCIFYGLGYIAGKTKKIFVVKHIYKIFYKKK
ncbi:MAG: hypothetical protein J6D26_07485 [Clostridia bacterium]|nr:hypothetical protein [Clostridia bacterium]